MVVWFDLGFFWWKLRFVAIHRTPRVLASYKKSNDKLPDTVNCYGRQ